MTDEKTAFLVDGETVYIVLEDIMREELETGALRLMLHMYEYHSFR